MVDPVLPIEVVFDEAPSPFSVLSFQVFFNGAISFHTRASASCLSIVLVQLISSELGMWIVTRNEGNQAEELFQKEVEL